FEGSIMHRDSLGSEVEIKPGAVNWMTAGKGVVHSERTPDHLRNSNKEIHGLQIWVALPKEVEETTPSFTHIEADKIPEWEQDGLRIRLIAGEVFKRKSPVPVYSNLYFIEIKSQQPQKVTPGNDLYGESAIYILEGSITSKGNTHKPQQLLIAKDNKLCEFDMAANSTVYIFGGDSLPEEHYIDWNFVSSSKNRLKQAKEDWKNQTFPKVPGETEFVPYPGQRK
uniref:pirin family protein n=1 Tax=Marinilabilia sp. TaxID=2021252 RepID=UPI0025C28BF6